MTVSMTMPHDSESHTPRYSLTIEARFRPEVLERVLRVTRHRGFQVCAMNMVLAEATDRVTIELTVSSLRPLQSLCSQLMKLIDVVNVHQPAAVSPVAQACTFTQPLIRA
ncbi:MAG: acetolactate synthase 2 small subunit [Plesiomonas sp.]|uniref:acetolactate synthase 2 small subunit n=1 Tax=Plesiomonas sp. TaxID=2486279 RepID=UPI003F350634